MSRSMVNLIGGFVLLAGLTHSISSATAAVVAVGGGWGGPTHYHDGYRPGPYYGRGGYWGGGWLGPNVIINVPVERYAPPPPPPGYYVRDCDEVEVCDSYGRCWLERYCD